MVHNYKVIVAYDGSAYHGWAKQGDTPTIQNIIEQTLSRLLNEKIIINGSGRTDAFVHAYNQVFSFKTKNDMNRLSLIKSLRSMLPNDIVIKSIKLMPSDFHARFKAKSKEYIYKICTNSKDPFANKYNLIYNKKLNLNKMKKASKLFIGEHDFLSFSISEIDDTIRTIKSIKFKKEKKIMSISFIGTGFLRAMVRMLVGSLLDYNENKKSLDTIVYLLNNPKKGSAITKVRASGLYLNKVKY
ncbi:MAG: tRNA pseudouridine(38-40) synthase TruA [Mycoplasmoidaceae bacterium]|nr:MAG: tRNA pseudouridine(38-40) synthase TruA [Mycoplasmoidaceae bacterium]